jgi:YD repeat-containing protein
MRPWLILGALTGCGGDEAVPTWCAGTISWDYLDDGTSDRQEFVRIDAEGRTLREAAFESSGSYTVDHQYDANGLVRTAYTFDGELVGETRWKRRPDGQPLWEETVDWSVYEPQPLITVYEYEGDLLSRVLREGAESTYHYDEHGRPLRIEIGGEVVGGGAAVVDYWYTGPAPSLDGGIRTDQGHDGTIDHDMAMWYDGERIIEERGTSFGTEREATYDWHEDGRPAASWERIRGMGPHDDETSESETEVWRTWTYDEGRRPIELEVAGSDATTRASWSWVCPGEVRAQ